MARILGRGLSERRSGGSRVRRMVAVVAACGLAAGMAACSSNGDKDGTDDKDSTRTSSAVDAAFPVTITSAPRHGRDQGGAQAGRKPGDGPIRTPSWRSVSSRSRCPLSPDLSTGPTRRAF